MYTDPETGSLTRNVTVDFDFERTQDYVLLVSAQDSGDPINEATIPVIINIMVYNRQHSFHLCFTDEYCLG